MSRSEPVELTVLCMACRDGEILLQDRVKADWRGYCLPGGHVEPGESVVDAVVREMREETGLTVAHPRLCGLKQFPTENGRYLVLLFKTDEFSGELASSEEGAVHWVKRSELANYETVDDLEALLQVMEDPDLSEFQYVVENGNWLACVK